MKELSAGAVEVRRTVLQVWPQRYYHLLPESDAERLQGVMLPAAWLQWPPPLWESERALVLWRTRCRLREGEYTVVDPPHTNMFAAYWRERERPA